MAIFETECADKADGELKALLEEAREGLEVPFTPLFFRTQACNSLNVARGSWGLISNILTKGVLPRVLKEMVLTHISSRRNCSYCEAVHISMCKALGLDDNIIETIVQDIESLNPERTRKAIHFAEKVARDPQGLQDSDYEEMRDMGMSDEELMELIATAAITVYMNTMADATKIHIDPELGAPVN